MGARTGILTYIGLAEIAELKLAAGRQRDLADVVELMRVNLDRADEVRRHLQSVHAKYAIDFDRCLQEAQQPDR